MDLEISSDILECVMEIIPAAAYKYSIEDERMKKMREILSKIFGTISLITYGNGCKSDGMITAKVGQLDAYTGILEGKNEIGSGLSSRSITLPRLLVSVISMFNF